VHHQDRLGRVAWLWERIQVGEIQACISAWKPKVGTGIMVRHGFPSPLHATTLTTRESAFPNEGLSEVVRSICAVARSSREFLRRRAAVAPRRRSGRLWGAFCSG